MSSNNKKLDLFVDSLICEDELHPEAIAGKFSLFCNLSRPPGYLEIINASYDLVPNITIKDFPDSLKGFHAIYKDDIQISLRNDESAAIAHTLLHELFEIIIERLNTKRMPAYELNQYKANLFAASVLMPEDIFFKFALRSNLDLNLICQRYWVSYSSLLIRLQYLFQQHEVHYVGILAENKNCCVDGKDNAILNASSNFKITNLIYDSAYNYLCFNSWFTWNRILNKCREAIMSQENNNKTTLTIADGDFLLKASPLMHRENHEAIKTIGIQSLLQKSYEMTLKEVL